MWDEIIHPFPNFNGAVEAWKWRSTWIPHFVHDDVIKWKQFPRYWPFALLARSPVNSPHKSQWRWALMFSLICAWINGWVNNRDAGDLRRHGAKYDVIVMQWMCLHALLTGVVSGGKHPSTCVSGPGAAACCFAGRHVLSSILTQTIIL